MPKVYLPSLLQDVTGGVSEVSVPARTVRALLDALDAHFPGIRQRLCTEEGLRPGIALWVDGEPTRGTLTQVIGEDSEIHFLPAVSGGGRTGDEGRSNVDVARLHRWIEEHQDEMVEALSGALQIPSKKEPPAGPGAPYGQTLRNALDYTLNLCRKLGFQVRDVEGYAGHAEFGSGEEMVAALGHLDVVPEGDRWRHPPFGAEIDDGYIYARGASDDKGPTYAALFGAKALMEIGLPLRRRVRVIFGCDEESGFGCVKHYWEVAKEERPLYAFTPDACFPLIYAEKGIATLVLERRVEPGEAALRVVEARGGLRSNMVPESAEARIEGPTDALYRALCTLLGSWDRNLRVEPDPTGISVIAYGKSAHGSTPDEGDNAIVRLARALLELDLPADRPWLEWIPKSAVTSGRGLGIQGHDEVAGPLTCNLGIFELSTAGGELERERERGREGAILAHPSTHPPTPAVPSSIRLTYNLRYPVTWKLGDLLERCRPKLEEAGWALARSDDSPPLYVPLDQEPVKTLLRVYQEETGDTSSRPETMGGGTYARATPRAVAFGAAFPGGSDGPAHEPDERIAIASLVRAAKIYAHALYELAR